MSRLALALTDPTANTIIPLPWHRATQATMETDEHGCAALSVTLPLTARRALPFVSDGMGLDLACYAAGRAIWRGRVEEPGIQLDETSSMLTLTAYGYQQAFDDIPYTALWSTTGNYDEWHPVKGETYATGHKPDRYTIDTNGRLWISPIKNAQLGNNNDQGALDYYAPAGGSRSITSVAFDWAAVAYPGMRPRLLSYSNGTLLAAEWTPTISSANTLFTGTVSKSVTACNRLVFEVDNNSGGTVTNTYENGQAFLRILNLKVQTAASVTPDAIVKDMLSTVRATNSTQLSNVTSRIQVPGLTLPDESYIDANMRDVLDTLAGYGDSATPPNRWTWRVWADQVLRYEPLSTDTRTYTVSVGQYQADRALKQVYNQVYAAYQDASGTRSVTSTATTSTPPRVTRRLALNSQSTTSAQATQERDAALSDQGNPLPRVSMTITRLSDANGAPVPTWYLRAGDVVQVRDLAPTLSTQIDRFRSFRTIHTKLDLLSGAVDVDLESPQPQLDWLLARRGIGY